MTEELGLRLVNNNTFTDSLHLKICPTSDMYHISETPGQIRLNIVFLYITFLI